MIVDIRALTCSNINFRNIISRSSVRDVPNAVNILSDFHRQSVFTWVGTVDDIVACMWGLIPPTILSDRAYLWLLTTDLIDEHKFRFIRQSQLAMEKMLAHYPTITGHVDPYNQRAIHWLKWLGARFLDPEGVMIPFVIEAK